MSRGHPASYVTCDGCGSPEGWPISRRCRECVSKASVVQFPFSAEQDRILRAAYAVGTNRPKLTAALTDAVRRIGYPRSIVKSRAQRLGLTQDTRQPWKQEEIAFLAEHAGQRSVKWIAGQLKRGDEKVRAQMERHHISRRVREGYAREDVMQLMGVSQPTVIGWITRGLLTVLHGNRITENSLRRLIFAHPELYSLRKVDEWLFKSMVFSTAVVFMAPAANRSARVHQENARFGPDAATPIDEMRGVA